MSSIKHQGRSMERTSASTVFSLTYQGSKEEMDALAAARNIYESGGESLGGAILRTVNVHQGEGHLWECELTYETAGGQSITPPDRAFGVRLTVLHGAVLSRPLEGHPDYLAQWNHFLFASPAVSSDTPPLWADNATDVLIDAENADKYAWGRNVGDCPSDARGRWRVVMEPIKPGVDSYDIATYTITETIRCGTHATAGAFVVGKLNKIGAPHSTLGVTGGNWKCDDAEVSWQGKYWIARLTWTRSGDNDGWDTDLYESINSGNNSSSGA